VVGVLTLAFEEAREGGEYGQFLQDNYMERWEVDGIEAQLHLAEATEQFAAQIADSGVELGSAE
jgi:hypothetical protein